MAYVVYGCPLGMIFLKKLNVAKTYHRYLFILQLWYDFAIFEILFIHGFFVRNPVDIVEIGVMGNVTCPR